jgi:hypothetical protein
LGKLAMSPDGALLAAGGHQKNGRTLVILETVSGKQVMEMQTSSIHRWILAGDNRTVVTMDDKFIRVWDLPSRNERYRLELPNGAARNSQAGQGLLTPVLTADGRQLVTEEPDGTILTWDLSPAFGSNAAHSENIDVKRIAGWWTDLASADPAVAYAAIWKLTDSRENALAILRKQMKPAGDADFDKVRKLIKELDDDRFDVRQTASRELEKMGAGIQPALRHALNGHLSREVRRRLELLVQDSGGVSQSPELLRHLRAIGILERIASKDARQLLTNLALGVPYAPETQAAKTALERLGHRPD